jgi:hypothetical protein
MQTGVVCERHLHDERRHTRAARARQARQTAPRGHQEAQSISLLRSCVLSCVRLMFVFV